MDADSLRARALQHVLANPPSAFVPSNPARINCVCCGLEVVTRDAIECQQCSHLALPATYFCSTACCADENHNTWHAQHEINEERRDALNVNSAVGNMALAEDLGQFNEGTRNESMPRASGHAGLLRMSVMEKTPEDVFALVAKSSDLPDPMKFGLFSLGRLWYHSELRVHPKRDVCGCAVCQCCAGCDKHVVQCLPQPWFQR